MGKSVLKFGVRLYRLVFVVVIFSVFIVALLCSEKLYIIVVLIFIHIYNISFYCYLLFWI